jgi:hypothetical protein
VTAHRAAHGALAELALATHRSLELALAAHGALAHRSLAHRSLTHGALAELTLATHRRLAHRARTVLSLRTRSVLSLGPRAVLALGTVTARPCRQLRLAALKLGRSHLRLLLGLRWTGYGGRHRGIGTTTAVLLLGLAHALLLILRGGTCGSCQLGAQILVLTEQPGQLGFDLVEEGINLVLVIAFAEPDGRELLVPHVLGGQRHLFFTST